MSLSIPKRLSGACVLLLLTAQAPAPGRALLAPLADLPAAAAPPAPPAAGPAYHPGPAPVPSRSAITLNVGAGRVITLAQPATSLFAADPKIAEVRPASPTSLFVFGVGPGRTTIAAIGDGGVPVAQIDLTVQPSNYGSSEVAQIVRRALPGRATVADQQALGGVRIEPTPAGYRVTGHVATPADAERVMASLRPYLGPGQAIDNRLAVDTPLTVNLRVRVVEVSRTVTRQLGVNWSGLLRKGDFLGAVGIVDRVSQAINLPDQIGLGVSGANGSLNAVVDALAQDQLAVILAEPNLTAQSGETASFLAGGEYPIPVAQQNNTITVDYKQYGVSLAFVPTVLSADRISLKVRPEVSELTTQGAVTIGGGNYSLSIPALTVRRAETTVELGSGQSFAIAGLLSDNATQNARGLPGLGEVPILGALFRSTAFQRGETELVIVVTPYLVRGVNDPTALVVPTTGLVLANDLERILYNRQRARGSVTAPVQRVPVDAGFILP